MPSSYASRPKSNISGRVQTNGSSPTGNARALPQHGSVSDMNDGCSGVVRYGTGSAATWHFTAARIFLMIGMSVVGPRWQFTPTTSAPAASSRTQVSSGLQPSRLFSSLWTENVTTAGTFEYFLMASSAMIASAPQEKVSATM